MRRVTAASCKAMPFLLTCIVLGITSKAMAADTGHGRMSVQGSIVETPCAIDVGDRNQTLYMGSVPISQIIRDGKGPQKDFSIRLFDCVLAKLDSSKPDWRAFEVMFDGENDNGHFRTQGEARGIAMMIQDKHGNTATPGSFLPAGGISAGDMKLSYTLNLVGNRETLRAGDYRSTIRFKINYY